MKKTIITIISAFAVIISSYAQQTVTQTKEQDPFDEIKVTGKFNVTLKNSSSYSVKITSDERIADYIRCVVKGGVLTFVLDEKNYPSELKKELKAKGATDPVLHIEVYMPHLTKLSVDGNASILDSDQLSANQFELEATGHSVINKLFLDCGSADLRFSKNCKANVSVTIKTRLEVDTENNANVNIRHNGGNGMFETRGSAILNLYSESPEIQFESSGSSESYVSGTVDMLAVQTSGSSHIDAEVLDAKEGKFNMDGSSVCNINVAEHIKVNLEGGSTLTFKRNPEIEVERILKSTLIKADDPDRKK